MNNKKWIILVVIFVILIVGTIFFFMTDNSTNNEQANSSYEANKTSSESNTNENITSNDNQNTQSEEENGVETPTPAPQPVEEQIATFSTKIYSQDSARQNNISITCNTLNGTVVKNGETFSFCNTIGPSTISKGYQEADIFDKNGKKKKGLGGGNCQISTTLYNAALAVPNLTITERHAHSNNVPYIQKGKDAAVAYGSYDLKFVNNTGNDIKLLSQASNTTVTVSIIALK